MFTLEIMAGYNTREQYDRKHERLVGACGGRVPTFAEEHEAIGFLRRLHDALDVEFAEDRTLLSPAERFVAEEASAAKVVQSHPLVLESVLASRRRRGEVTLGQSTRDKLSRHRACVQRDNGDFLRVTRPEVWKGILVKELEALGQ